MYIFISYSNNYYGNYEILVFLSDMSEMQCFKRQSINIQVTFDIIIDSKQVQRIIIILTIMSLAFLHP